MEFKQLALAACLLFCAAANALEPQRNTGDFMESWDHTILELLTRTPGVLLANTCQCTDCSLAPTHASVTETRGEHPSPPDLWVRIREHLALSKIDHPRVSLVLRQYRQFPYTMELNGARAVPILHYVLQQVRARGMPADIALLPMLESGFRTTALSHAKAKGLWQLMPTTASRFGLEDNWWLDARLDIESSTRAALDYLAYLHKRFEGDWLLALAAYNAGEGRVSRAMRSNREAGLPTDFWHLSLPAETRSYVPHLLAISRIASDPKRFGVDFKPIADKPYLQSVGLKHHIDLETVADLAGLDLGELRMLNPALKRDATHPDGPHRLLLPSEAVEKFRFALTTHSATLATRQRKSEYTVRSGDNLWVIAKHFGVSFKHLAGWNDLELDSVLRPGRKLIVWRT